MPFLSLTRELSGKPLKAKDFSIDVAGVGSFYPMYNAGACFNRIAREVIVYPTNKSTV